MSNLRKEAKIKIGDALESNNPEAASQKNALQL